MLRDLRREFIRTPLERPLRWLRQALGYPERLRHPELREIHREEGRLATVLERVLRRSSSCIDVGCHYGSFLSHLCRLAPGGRHLAFEAVPSKVRFLRRRFPEVDVRELALTDRSGTARFYVDLRATGFSGLARPGRGAFEQIEVACASLDDVVPRDRRFDLLKLDVEGAELLVLRGAAEFLARDHPLVLFECGPAGPPAFGYSAGELHDFLTGECGYSIFFLAVFLDRGSPVSRAAFEEALVYPFKAFNWIGVPRERLGAQAPGLPA